MNKRFIAAACLAALGTAHAAPATYAIDPTHTFATFEILHFGTSTYRGRFDKKDGSVTIDTAAKTGKVELSIDLTSVSTGVEGLNKHLQTKDFFNTAEFPTAKFVADKFSFNGDKVTDVTGTLTFLGKTQPVTLKATRFGCYTNPMLKREVCGGDFDATIMRSQWGMGYGMPAVLPDAVRLLVQVEAIKQ
jgi:polyisoprenoid-binding protein YceI